MELVYPVSIAPIAPGNRGSKEMLPVVDLSGSVIARASRAWCHGGSKLLHPVVHLHIIDRYGKVCLQLRSMIKHTYPLMWDTAVGGHVSYGEYLQEALFREASEELGLVDFNPIPLKEYVYESPTRRELVCVYAAVGHFPINPDREEVAECRWWSVPEIEEAYGKGILAPTFEEEFKTIKDSLLALL